MKETGLVSAVVWVGGIKRITSEVLSKSPREQTKQHNDKYQLIFINCSRGAAVPINNGKSMTSQIYR